MSCKYCVNNVFKEKLGRCPQCFYINLFLVLVTGGLYICLDLSQLQAVQRVALLMVLLAATVLLLMHIIVWCYYRLRGKGD